MASPTLPYCTYRLTNIPGTFTNYDLRRLFSSDDQKAILYSSLVPATYRHSGSVQVGTVTFKEKPEGFKDGHLRSSPANPTLITLLGASPVEIDDHFHGLTPLNEGSLGDKTVDIVAVTGLAGKAFASWQAAEGSMWLRDFLPQDVENIRVSIFGYSSELFESNSNAGLLDYTKIFLQTLQNSRNRKTGRRRPLILIGHSLGCLIIKQALINCAESKGGIDELYCSIYSVVFFGAPHRGLSTFALESLVQGKPPERLVRDLKRGSTLLTTLNESFPSASKDIKIITCYELRETPTTKEGADGRWGRTGPLTMMVEKDSACLYTINEYTIPINENHSRIAKLSSGPESSYHVIKGKLLEHVHEAPAAIQGRFRQIDSAEMILNVYYLAHFVYQVICGDSDRHSHTPSRQFIKATLLEIARSFTRYFKNLAVMMAKLGDCVSIYGRYETMLGQAEPFQAVLSDVYFEIWCFCGRQRLLLPPALMILGQGIKVLVKGIWKSLESEFQVTLDSLSRLTSLLEAEITLAHRGYVKGDIEEQKLYRKQTCQTLDKLLQTSSHKPTERQDQNKCINLEAEQRRAILDWLSPVDSSEDLQRALKKRVETSGQWIVHEPVFRNLVNLHLRGVESSVAWIYGAPGSGKSVLSASVVQHLQHQLAHQEDAVLAYFFCDTRDKQKKSILAIVRSLIAQILTQLKATPSSLSTAYENAMKYGRSRISSTDQPLMLVKSLATSLSATFIVLDGLDECDDPSEVAQSFADVACLSETVRLVCFSRESTALKARLGQFPSLKLTAALTKPDIDNYLSTAVMELPTDEASTRKEVFEKLSRDADGMFLWAHLMVQNLKSATNTKEILEMLAELPVGLDVVYDFILQRLSKESSRRRMLVRKIYSWVCCSTRSLSWSELQCALALDRDDSSLLGSRRPFKSAVLELCRPLIEYNPSSDVFRPAHLSVQEFLMGRSQSFGISQEAKQFFIEEEIAHREIAELCLTYVSCTELANAVNVDPQRFPLADYATMHWCHHLSSSPADSALYQKVTQFLSSPCRRRTWITRSLLSKETAFPLQKIMRLQRLVRGWTSTISEEPICPIDEIGDIQQALLDLDQYQELDSKPDKPLRQSVGKISSFERLMAFRDLAREFTMSGRLDDGVSWLMKSLKRVQQLQGPASVETAWLLNSLGILYDQQGKIDLALQTQREALTIQESWLPCDHFDTTMTINELGRIYRHLGCYGEAEAMHLRALQALQKSLPDDDLQIVWTLNTLARSYRKQGRVSEAIELHNQALAGQSQHLGREHPHTLWTMTDLGRCYRDQGRLLEAYDVQQKAIGLRTKVLGAHHADTLWSINDLGIVLEQLGQFVEAERVHTLALQGQALTLGESNKHTDWTRQALTRLKIRIAVEPDTHSLEPSST